MLVLSGPQQFQILSVATGFFIMARRNKFYLTPFNRAFKSFVYEYLRQTSKGRWIFYERRKAHSNRIWMVLFFQLLITFFSNTSASFNGKNIFANNLLHAVQFESDSIKKGGKISMWMHNLRRLHLLSLAVHGF